MLIWWGVSATPVICGTGPPITLIYMFRVDSNTYFPTSEFKRNEMVITRFAEDHDSTMHLHRKVR
jgi:hypothetical protein